MLAIPVPRGITLEVKLDSRDDAAANELYARFEALPDSIRYDAAAVGSLVGDRVLRIPTTVAGTYYVRVRSSQAAANNPIRLTARAVPFGIESVT
ncbi:MAG: hypothetical protein EBW55_05665, partial [Betaproteobacteria bacterium]|nr:hypothetical protein [Betaproteobacteria bacterium]